NPLRLIDDMVFNVAAYAFNKVQGMEELSRDIVAVRTEMKAKDRCCAERRSALQRSVNLPLPGNDREFCRLQLEARQLRELYEALKAKYFYTFSAVPYDKKAEEEKLAVAVPGYRQIRKDVADAMDFAVQIKGFDEDDSAKIRIAQLEAKQLIAFNLLKNAQYKIKAVDAWHTRFSAAERVIAAYNKKRDAMRPMRLYAPGGEDAIEAARAALGEAVAKWNEASVECRQLRHDIEECRFPLHGASREQRLVQSGKFQDKLRKHGDDAAIAYAATLGVDVKHHLDAQRKAPSTFKEVFSAEAKPVISGDQSTSAAAPSIAARPSSEAMRSPSVASSWDQLSADRSASASLDITVSATSDVASHNDTGSTIGSWFMEPKQSGNTRRSSCISSVAGASNAARRCVPTDSEDSDATVTDLKDRTSTPIDRGNATEALQRFRASAAEFGDTTTDSLASFVPRSSLARPVRSAQEHYGYVPAALRDSQDFRCSPRAVQPQPRVVYPGYASLRARPVSVFDSVAAPHVDAQPCDYVVEVDFENSTGFFAPLRRGISDGHFLTLVRNGHFGRAFPDAVKCVVAKSDPNCIPACARRRDNLDEPHAAVNFATPADAALCLKLVNDAARDFGVTPMGDNDAPRKLDSEWCLNPHLNGYNRAPRRRVPRY
ncbi:hypothetical protein AAVH_31199, partial [Aphelenchoides avenae]